MNISLFLKVLACAKALGVLYMAHPAGTVRVLYNLTDRGVRGIMDSAGVKAVPVAMELNVCGPCGSQAVGELGMSLCTGLTRHGQLADRLTNI